MPAQLTLTIGIPGCGKSHWASEQLDADPDNVVIVERDRIREALYGSRSMENTDEGFVSKIAMETARYALSEGKHVIVSDTNTVPKYRKPWLRLAEDCGILCEYKTFDTPLHVCLVRNALRPPEMRVPEDVIHTMHARLQ